MEFSNSLSVEKKLLQVKISEKEGGEKWIQNQEKLHGMILASLAASLWSISGISGEILFKKYNFSSDWLVSTRTLISGILLFLIVILIEKKSVLKPLKNKRDIIGIILFGSAGMYFVQYTYFRTIELSNVSFATILQFTAPFFIFIYESVKNKKIPAISTLLLLFMTVLGVVFIATQKEKFQVYLSFQKHCLLDFFQQL